MKKIKLITLIIAATGLTAFKNYDKYEMSKKNSHKKIESHVGTQINYNVDKEKSTFGWHGKKVTGEHWGTCKVLGGFISRNNGVFNGGEFQIDMTSIADTDLTNPEYRSKLEGHLKSKDFFDVADFPMASFKVKTLALIKDAKPGTANYYVKGDLTIKGISKEITFPAFVNLDDKTVTASAEIKIDRTDFGLKYNSAKFDPGIGDKMIYDEFDIKVNLIATIK
jgi:polyisoprenoid-binding protein YceI